MIYLNYFAAPYHKTAFQNTLKINVYSQPSYMSNRSNIRALYLNMNSSFPSTTRKLYLLLNLDFERDSFIISPYH